MIPECGGAELTPARIHRGGDLAGQGLAVTSVVISNYILGCPAFRILAFDEYDLY